MNGKEQGECMCQKKMGHRYNFVVVVNVVLSVVLVICIENFIQIKNK